MVSDVNLRPYMVVEQLRAALEEQEAAAEADRRDAEEAAAAAAVETARLASELEVGAEVVQAQPEPLESTVLSA